MKLYKIFTNVVGVAILLLFIATAVVNIIDRCVNGFRTFDFGDSITVAVALVCVYFIVGIAHNRPKKKLK